MIDLYSYDKGKQDSEDEILYIIEDFFNRGADERYDNGYDICRVLVEIITKRNE